MLPRPSAPPPEEMIRAPIWTTWARYKAGVTQVHTENFAAEIAERGLPRSIMEIDDRWQAAYGELDFDRSKFPDPKAMVDRLHEQGFKVTLWVMPFCEENSDAYKEGLELGHFVTSDTPSRRARSPFAPSEREQGSASMGLRACLADKEKGSQPTPSASSSLPLPRPLRFGMKPGFLPWWNSSPVVALDVTSPEAVRWFTDRLRALQAKYGIDGFKFDAGEPCFLPREFKTKVPLAHPCEYTRAWVRNVASQFEVRGTRRAGGGGASGGGWRLHWEGCGDRG